MIKALHLPPRCQVFAVTVASLFSGVFLNRVSADVLNLSSAAVAESSTDGGNPSFVGSHAFDGTTATRWSSEASGGAEWLYVDLGADAMLHSMTIDWETANATVYEIRVRTDAQGPAESPGDWTRVATVNGANGLAEGGAVGDDHRFDFDAGTVTSLSGIGGTNAIEVVSPSGRYLMVHAVSYAGACCNWASIWEITVDATIGTVDPIILGHPVISEFMADNGATLLDGDGAGSDWIEIHNASLGAVNMGGWYMTDDPVNLTKWEFPSQVLQPDESFVLFASGKDRALAGGELHTNFELQDAGEYLALVDTDGITRVSEFSPTFPPQKKDVSYGTLGQAQTLGYFTNPTPGARNAAPQGLPAEPPSFSLDSGLITAPVDLELSLPPSSSPTAEIRYTFDGSTPNGTSPLYSSALSISSTSRVRARVYDPAGGTLPSGVGSRDFALLGADLQSFSSNLPIAVIDSFGVDIDSSGTAGSRTQVFSAFIDLDPGTGRAAVIGMPDYAGSGGMRVRGSSSAQFYPKKQYSFETWDGEDMDLNVSLFGMPAESDWVLSAPYADKTLMRNHLAYRCFEDFGHYSVRTQFFELFYNADGGAVDMADYHGIYLLVERIKRDAERVDISALEAADVTEPDISGGYIIKRDRPEPDDTTFRTAIEFAPLIFSEPEVPNAEQIDYLLNYMNTFESALHGAGFADPANGYAKYIDVGSWIDQHLLIEGFKNVDGFRLSTFYVKDRNGRLSAGPAWDYNIALGNVNSVGGDDPVGWYHEQLQSPPPLPPFYEYSWYPRLFEDPEFTLRYRDRYFELRQQKWNTTSMFAEIDALAALLSAEAAPREFDRWPRLGSYVWPNPDGFEARTTYQSEIDWMKDWLLQRFAWMDSQFNPPPVYSEQGGAETFGGNVPLGFVMEMSNPNLSGGDIHYTLDGSDPHLPQTVPGTTAVYSSPLTLEQSVAVKARVLSPGGVWGAMRSATFIVDAVRADTTNLVVSEINYRPAAASQAELDAGFTRNDFEFVELVNIGSSRIDLSGVAFVGGIDFRFDDGAIGALSLTPGQRVLVVENEAAFAFRYDPPAGVLIAGVYGGKLDNDGEQLILQAADLGLIRDFTYNDATPWPTSADGGGFSLVLIAPDTNPDHADPLSWRSSVGSGGSPGGGNATSFSGDPDGDDDGNGQTNFLQYGFGGVSGGDPFPQSSIDSYNVDGAIGDYLTLRFNQNLAADDVLLRAEISNDLATWNSGAGFLELVSRVNNGAGTATWTYRSARPISADRRLFTRVFCRQR